VLPKAYVVVKAALGTRGAVIATKWKYVLYSELSRDTLHVVLLHRTASAGVFLYGRSSIDFTKGYPHACTKILSIIMPATSLTSKLDNLSSNTSSSAVAGKCSKKQSIVYSVLLCCSRYVRVQELSAQR
jgi:hypothetical protein